MAWLFSIPGTLLAIAALISFHEFGHFIVAKALGVNVRVFSLGFGGRMFGVKWRGTDYRLSWIPFGGYVRMAGGDPFAEGGAEPDGEEPVPYDQHFMAKPPWKRLLIVMAGPAFNLALPFGLFTALGALGEPQPRAEVGNVEAGSAAEQAGVRVGDQIVAVDGRHVLTWYDLMDEFKATHGSVALDLTRKGKPVTVLLTDTGIAASPADQRAPYDFGLGVYCADSEIGVDDPASPAGQGGLQTGDVIRAVNRSPVRAFHEVAAALTAVPAGSGVQVEVTRAGASVTVTLQDGSWAPQPHPGDDAVWTRWGIVSAGLLVDRVDDESAASKAGVLAGDRILAIDDAPVHVWYDVVKSVSATSAGKGQEMTARELLITFRRGGVVQSLRVTPDVVTDSDDRGEYRTRARLGLAGAGQMVAAPDVARVYPIGQAFTRACDQTVQISSYIVTTLTQLIIGQRDPSKTLGGPVLIFEQMKQAADLGVLPLLRQIGILSLSLGVINLVPIPVLDGGQIFMYLAEWLRGRPLPQRLRERAQQVGIIFVVLLMLAVTLKDIIKPNG